MQYTAVVQDAAGRILSGWDGIFVVLFLFVVLVVAGVLVRTRLVIGLVSLYITTAILSLLSSPSFPQVSEWMNKAGFGVGALLTLAIVVGSVLGASVLRTSTRRKEDKVFVYRLAYSFSFVGLLLSMAMARLPQEGFQQFSPLVWRLFGSPIAQVVWMLVPLAVMLVARNRRTRR